MIEEARIQHPTCGRREINFPARRQKQCTHDESSYGVPVVVAFQASNQSGRLQTAMGTHQEETFYISAMSYAISRGECTGMFDRKQLKTIVSSGMWVITRNEQCVPGPVSIQHFP